jgi:hypothetical protein
VPVGEGSYRPQLSQHQQGWICTSVYVASFRSLTRRCNFPMSVQKNVEWLQHHTEQYRSTTNDMCEAIKDFEEVEELRQGFSSADPLEDIDIGDGIISKPTFVNKNMYLEHKDDIIKFLKEYVDCFA